MQRSKIDIWVGFFVMLGFSALLFLVLQAANLLATGSGASYTVTAQFDNIGGLKPRAVVTSAGVVVGRVQSISLNTQNFLAQVELSIEDTYHFPKDSSVQILTSGVLGKQFIGISPGYESANWQAGDKTKNTQSAFILENLLGQLLTSNAEGLGVSYIQDANTE